MTVHLRFSFIQICKGFCKNRTFKIWGLRNLDISSQSFLASLHHLSICSVEFWHLRQWGVYTIFLWNKRFLEGSLSWKASQRKLFNFIQSLNFPYPCSILLFIWPARSQIFLRKLYKLACRKTSIWSVFPEIWIFMFMGR